MKILVTTYKVGWKTEDGFVTYAGFPYQMEAISHLFDETKVALLIRKSAQPGGCVPIKENNIQIFPLPEPASSDLRRKIDLLLWLPRHLPTLWREITKADAIHAPIPGDVGFIGLLIALIQRKRVFVRHCGTWGEPVTLSDRILLWLLEKIADEDRHIVFATGGAETPPSRKNPHIRWIFSTTLTQRELEETPRAQAWQRGQALRLVTVGRLSQGKNIQSLIRALPLIQNAGLECTLDIAGDGEYRRTLEELAQTLGVTQNIKFHGNLSHENVLKILSQSHLFVFPTQVKEGFPKALLEAMACALPSIATCVSVVPQLLKNGAGVLLNETDKQTIAKAVIQLTATSNEMAQMGIRAHQAAQGYTLEAWAETIGTRLRAAWGELRTNL